MLRLNVYKTHPDVVAPDFATKQSACFDLAFSNAGKNVYSGYNEQNAKFERPLHNGRIYINPGDRVLVPTGLILDIPKGYSVRIHPRSGLSLKQGLILANAEGVIDSDYVEELFLLMTNKSTNGLWINPGDRLAQGELVEKLTYAIHEINEKPGQKTDRVGGMGSTGVVVIKTDPVEPVKRGRGRPKKTA
jgi:dUTP pyrophosphatase